jgi:hypothetical protein
VASLLTILKSIKISLSLFSREDQRERTLRKPQSLPQSSFAWFSFAHQPGLTTRLHLSLTRPMWCMYTQLTSWSLEVLEQWLLEIANMPTIGGFPSVSHLPVR